MHRGVRLTILTSHFDQIKGMTVNTAHTPPTPPATKALRFSRTGFGFIGGRDVFKLPLSSLSNEDSDNEVSEDISDTIE